MLRQILLDTETTGLSADSGDRVIEIGCVELVAPKLTGNNRHYYLNPGRDSHPEALRIHGITSEFLQDKPQFQAVVDDFLEYLSGAEVIIHNATFDVGFLNNELALLGRPPFKTHVEGIIDTFMEAGAIVMNPNCSVCWGSCQGVIGENEVLISTGTRNFKGRAGHPSSKVYLGSAATVTASAIAGKIATADQI